MFIWSNNRRAMNRHKAGDIREIERFIWWPKELQQVDNHYQTRWLGFHRIQQVCINDKQKGLVWEDEEWTVYYSDMTKRECLRKIMSIPVYLWYLIFFYYPIKFLAWFFESEKDNREIADISTIICVFVSAIALIPIPGIISIIIESYKG